MEAGTCPRRNPGRRAIFWYFWISDSVVRATSSAGTSTWISRFVLSAVSAGLTLYLSRAREANSPRQAERGSGCSSEFKDEVRQRQTPRGPSRCSYGWGHPLRRWRGGDIRIETLLATSPE